MANEIPATNTLTGSPGANENTTPPTADSSANNTDNNVTRAGLAVTRIAAAAGVIINDITSNAPTSCTPSTLAMPRSTANNTPNARTGTPRAAATTGSTLANTNGRGITVSTSSTTVLAVNSVTRSVESIATIWPTRRPNLLAALPSYNHGSNTPSPSPNASTAPVTESRSDSRLPSSPSRSAASTAPARAP